MLDLNRFAHSHDSLEIVQHGNLSCVRKTFRADIERARRNVEKQRLFRPIYTGMTRLGAAEVLEFQVFRDRAELLMPYIEGMTGHMFPVHATRNIGQTLSASLSTFLYSELNDSREQLVPTMLFREKMAGVSRVTIDPDLNRMVNDCMFVFDALPEEILLPVGACHGDLTLSNVILDPVSGITLIDFLDTYLESPLQDVAKLKQDFVYGWSFRKDSPSLSIKAEILCRTHFPQAVTQIERMYPVQVKLLTLLTLARIAPYVREDLTKNWLMRSMASCLGGFAL